MLATRETERVVLAAIRDLPSDGRFSEIPEDHPARDLNLTLPPVKAWRSRRFLAMLYQEGDHQRLSIQRTGSNAYIRPKNRDERPISWDELMEVKRAVGFGDSWAVEVFPPDRAVVNVASMRHLWLLPEAPPYAWVRGGEA